MSRRLVFITQAYTPDETILGVARDWVRALAARCAGVDVLALHGLADGAPPNVRVYSLGKERGFGRGAQAAAFYRALACVLPKAGAVLAHMVPRYALLALLPAAAARRPLALWYAQGGITRELRVAARLVRYILTPTRESFPLGGAAIDWRVVVTGHGIDTQRYAPDGTPPAEPKRFVAAGRLSPSKRYEPLIDAFAALERGSCRLRIVGGPLYETDRAYERRLRARVAQLGLEELVELAGPVPYAQMPAEYRAAWALAHTSATGSLDKVVLEAMACGTPVLSTAAPTRTALGELAGRLWCPPNAPDALARRLREALGWTARERAELAGAARAIVVRDHSLDRWADRVVRLLGVDS